jgi:hypothetical protein
LADVPTELSWTPKRSVFLRRIAVLACATFFGLTLIGLVSSLTFDLPLRWILPTAALLSLGFLIDDLVSWRSARFDRWLLREGKLIHEGPEGTAMVPMNEVARISTRFGGPVIVHLKDGRRLALRYLPHPTETAGQIATFLPPQSAAHRK